MIEAQLNNMEASIRNESITILELDNTIRPEELEKIKTSICNGIMNESIKSPSSETSDDYERLIMEIRSGNTVTILSPSEAC